jgi:hypothetical protein
MTQVGEGSYVPGEMSLEPPATKEEEKKGEKQMIKVRLSLFFDGTSNNRFNTQQRRLSEGLTANGVEVNRPAEAMSAQEAADLKKAKETYAKYGNPGNSYGNDHSNVSRLEMNVLEEASGYDFYASLYIEGIGTTNAAKDSTLSGQAFGLGSTGVKAKVQKGIDKAAAKLRAMLPSNAAIELLAVDTGGFSRGAAAARYCVHRVLNDEKGLTSLKTEVVNSYPLQEVKVLAVCLFDTVSSLGFNHRNDVPELKLDSVSNAKAVLQLAAAEEYRENFSLTNIDSAGGKGRQVFLPGAHSDIGGGYPKGASGSQERRCIFFSGGSRSIADFVLAKGWFLKSQLAYRPADISYGRARSVERVDVDRSDIRTDYSFIPLRLMADFAKEQGIPVHGKLYDRFNPSASVENPQDKAILEGVRSRIEGYAKGGGSAITDWDTNEPSFRAFRNRFLHFSSHTGIGMGMRTAGGMGALRPVREVIPG